MVNDVIQQGQTFNPIHKMHKGSPMSGNSNNDASLQSKVSQDPDQSSLFNSFDYQNANILGVHGRSQMNQKHKSIQKQQREHH
jgi:hypothetical protein